MQKGSRKGKEGDGACSVRPSLLYQDGLPSPFLSPSSSPCFLISLSLSLPSINIKKTYTQSTQTKINNMKTHLLSNLVDTISIIQPNTHPRRIRRKVRKYSKNLVRSKIPTQRKQSWRNKRRIRQGFLAASIVPASDGRKEVN